MNNLWERLSGSAAGLWRRLRVPTTEQRLRESQLDALVEQVVDAYNPRLRAVSGYRKKLRPVVEPAMAYFADLLAQIPGPVRMDPDSWASDPVLNALFGSAERMRQLASQDREVRRCFREHADADVCYALLTAMPSVRNVLGSELVGGNLQRDVRQTTLSFSDHRLDFPSVDPVQVGARLERFALQALAGRALEAVSAQESRIADLEERQRIVRIKQKVADVGSRAFDGMALGSDQPRVEAEAARSSLAELAEQLAQARQGLGDLDDHLTHLKAVFERPREFLTLESVSVGLDRMNVVRQGKAPEGGQDIVFTRGRRGDQPGRVFLFLSIPRAGLIPAEQLLREVERYTR